MSFMTFQKYSCNEDVFLLYDAECNEESLNEDIFSRLQYSTYGNGISGIIACSLGTDSCELFGLDGSSRKADAQAMSVYDYYRNSRQSGEEICSKAPYCKGCTVTDARVCEQCIRNTGRVYLEHITAA